MHAERSATPASLGEIALALTRAWPWLLCSTALGAALGGAALALAGPTFQARATILIEREGSSGFLGDLALLASLASAPAATSELVVLESRTLAEETLREGRDASGAWDADDEHHLGLETWVDDAELRPLTLLRRKLFDPPPPDVPLVLPRRELAARVVSASDDAPQHLRLTFLAPDRVRVQTAGLAVRLHLADEEPAELAYAARRPLEYRGLVLELEARGEYVGATFALEHRAHHEALELLQGKLHVRETALNSGVIELLVEDSDPRRAARIANALGKNYLDSLQGRGEKRASNTVTYLQGLLDDEFERFDQAQERIVALQQQEPELLAPESAAGALIEQLSTLEIERVQLELSQHAFDEIVTALGNGDARALARLDNTLNVGVLVDPVTAGLLAEYARLEAESGTLSADLLDGHPLVVANRAAAASLLEKTRAQLSDRRAGLAARVSELRAHGDELTERMRGMPAGLREIAEAKVQLEIHKELVPYLVKGLQGAEITRTSAETLADFVDQAAPPTDLSAPDAARLLVFGALLGLVLGAAGALVREPHRGRLHRTGELADALAGEAAVALPGWPTVGELCLREDPSGPRAEALRALRATLRPPSPAGAAEPGPALTIGLAGVTRDELAPRLAAELALAFALEGRRTLLVEADLRRPSQAERFGLARAEHGLARHLEQGGDWRELVRPTAEEALAVLPAGAVSRPAGDLVPRAALAALLAEAAAERDVVVLALPPAGEAPEVAALVPALDALVLVHRARSLTRARVADCARALRAAGARRLVGVLVGKKRAPRS